MKRYGVLSNQAGSYDHEFAAQLRPKESEGTGVMELVSRRISISNVQKSSKTYIKQPIVKALNHKAFLLSRSLDRCD